MHTGNVAVIAHPSKLAVDADRNIVRLNVDTLAAAKTIIVALGCFAAKALPCFIACAELQGSVALAVVTARHAVEAGAGLHLAEIARPALANIVRAVCAGADAVVALAVARAEQLAAIAVEARVADTCA
jgi:hypothetical protein